MPYAAETKQHTAQDVSASMGNGQSSESEARRVDDIPQDTAYHNNTSEEHEDSQQRREQCSDECPGCSDYVLDDEAVYINCAHAWHRDCMNDNFRNALHTRLNWPARCCDANPRIDHTQIQEFFDDDVLMMLLERAEQYESPNPIFCSNLSCSKFIPDVIVSTSQSLWVSCPLCNNTTCKTCKASSLQHPMPALCPHYLSQENSQLAEREGWKRCPRPACLVWIERAEGCDTVECPVCKTEFCYACGGELLHGIPCNCAGQNEWVLELRQWMRGDGEDDGHRREQGNQAEGEIGDNADVEQAWAHEPARGNGGSWDGGATNPNPGGW